MLRSKLALGTLIGLLVLATVGFVFYQLYKSYWPQQLTIAAGDVGGNSYDFAETLRDILAKEKPPIQLEIVAESDSMDAATMVQSGKADLGVMQLDKNSYPQIRLVALIYPELFFLVVHRDSDIQSAADLAGKVVATDKDEKDELIDILKYYGVSENQVKIKEVSSDDAHIAFVNRQIDAAFRWSEPTTDRVQDLVQEGQGWLVPFDQFESMRLTAPYLAEYMLPRGLYQADNPVVPAQELEDNSIYKALVANASVELALIRTITQILFEHQNTLVANFPLSVYLRSPIDTQIVGPSLHPGAQSYYDKDKPTVFEQYANEISFVFAAGPILASLFLALWAKIQNKQQTRIKLHIQAVQNALLRLSEAQDSQNAEVVEQRLLKILAQFTRDLNDGNIDFEHAQTFSLVWDKAITMARYRMTFTNSSRSFVPPS